MIDYAGYMFITLLVVLTLLKLVVGYIRVMKNKDVLLREWINSYSNLTIVMTIFVVVFNSFILINIFGRSYLMALYFTLYMVLSMIIDSQIIISESGFYYSSSFTKWSNVEEVVILSDSVIYIKSRTFLSKGFKIRNLASKELFLSVANNKCVVKL